MIRIHKFGVAALSCAFGIAIHAATALRFGSPISVTQTPTPTEKAKIAELAYLDGGVFKKATLFTYGDGPDGQQNVYAKASFDDGATWSAPVLLSKDAANAPTGGQRITARDSLVFAVDNDKPSVFAPPATSGAKVVVIWNSVYCPQNPAAANNAGSYINPLQGVGDFDGDGTPDRPYHCVWVATTVDPALAAWDVRQLTNGERDAIGEVVSGNSTGTAFALAWQEDPAGLQPGEAEGRGDGGMGSHATGGTNIWYTHAPSPSGTTLRANIAQLSDNNTPGTGKPGASRPNIKLSGSTAVVAYEETACPGGSGGKCIVHHSFAYSNHDTNSAGTIISDVTKTSRRVRFVLQGASSAGASNLRTVVLWRESPIATPAAPADIIVRRGLVDTAARPGSNGFLASDILADKPQNMTNVAASGGNANAHRAVVRGSFIGLAYDLTPNMDAANPEKTANPTANYNLFFRRSVEDGSAGSWSSPLNLSKIDSPSMTVVEPRTVPTPGTIVNPLTGTPDAGDTQDGNVFYVAYATESNKLVGQAGRVYVSRSADQGASFEPFVPVSSAQAGQSESQLRVSPDGSSAMVMWMGEQVIGDPSTKDAMYAMSTVVQLPDLNLAMATGASFTVGSQRTLELTLLNRGTGAARNVVLSGSLPAGLNPVGIAYPSACTFSGSVFRCAFPEIQTGLSQTISVTVSSATVGSYTVSASASSEELDANTADNTVASILSATVPVPDPVPTPAPVPDPVPMPVPAPDPGPVAGPDPAPAPADYQGGGCTMAPDGGPFDPSLLLLVALSLTSLALRRASARGVCAEQAGSNCLH